MDRKEMLSKLVEGNGFPCQRWAGSTMESMTLEWEKTLDTAGS
jgi:hypothetical protein